MSDAEDIKEEINILLEQWERLEEGFDTDKFYYGEKFMVMNPEQGQGRLMKAYNTSRYDPAFDTMTSMRNVDISVGSSVIIWEDEKSGDKGEN